MKKLIKDNATLIALVIMMIILGFMDSAFFTPRNLSNLTRQVTIIGIIAVGMTMVILIEGIDLSVGSVVGLAAIVMTLLMQAGVNVWLAVFLTILLAGVFVGMWNGFWIAHYKIPPFIITLGMMTVARGLALTLSNGGSVPVTDPMFPEIGGAYIPPLYSLLILALGIISFVYFLFRNMQQKKKYNIEINVANMIVTSVMVVLGFAFAYYSFVMYKGIPNPVAIFAVIAMIGIFVLRNTRFGRRVYAVGGNEEAARLSGINIYQTKLIVFTIVSSLSAVSGIILSSRLNGASPNLGNMFELDAIASVVIGGTSLSGGSGTIIGSVIGAFIIGILNNGMSLLGVNIFFQLIIKGLIIIAAVWFDVINKRK